MSVLHLRKYARVEVKIPITFAGKGKEIQAHLNNINEEGASLLSLTQIPIATSMEFDISLPKIKLPAHVHADILWSRKVNEDGQYFFVHGLLFDRMGIEDRERLHEYISHAMSY